MNVKVADTWVTIPEISLEQEDDGMKIEVGKMYQVIGSRYGYYEGDIVKIIKISEGKVHVLVLPQQHCSEDLEEFLKIPLEEIVEEVLGEPSKPVHYDTAIDTIAFAKANFTPEQVEGFMRINAIKYLQRVKKGQVLEDLKKSRSYIDMLIEMVEGK